MEALETKPQDEMAQVGGDYLSTAKSLTVLSNEDYTNADKLRQLGRAHKRKVDEFMDPLIDVAYKSHRGLTTAKKNLLAPVKEGIGLIGCEMESWNAKQEAIAEAERKKQEAEALEKEKEKTRNDMLDAAVALEQAGDMDGADELMGQAENPAVQAPTVTLKPNMPKVDGSYRSFYSAEVVDASLIPRKYLIPDMSALNQIARASKGQEDIPGVRMITQRKAVG